jgi:hypothetical protein
MFVIDVDPSERLPPTCLITGSREEIAWLQMTVAYTPPWAVPLKLLFHLTAHLLAALLGSFGVDPFTVRATVILPFNRTAIANLRLRDRLFNIAFFSALAGICLGLFMLLLLAEYCAKFPREVGFLAAVSRSLAEAYDMQLSEDTLRVCLYLSIALVLLLVLIAYLGLIWRRHPRVMAILSDGTVRLKIPSEQAALDFVRQVTG